MEGYGKTDHCVPADIPSGTCCEIQGTMHHAGDGRLSDPGSRKAHRGKRRSVDRGKPRQRPHPSPFVPSPKPEPVSFCSVAKKYPISSGQETISRRCKEVSVGRRFLVILLISSTGGASLDTVRQYIEDQGKPKRPYTKKSDSSPTQN